MAYTDEQRRSFREQFAQRRRRQVWVATPTIAALLGILLAQTVAREQVADSQRLMVGIFLALVVAVFAFSFGNWRCPACSRYLGRGLDPGSCPRCGLQLQ